LLRGVFGDSILAKINLSKWKINRILFGYLRKKLYVSTVIVKEMNEIIEKIAVRVAKGMKPTKVQMKKLHSLPMEWNKREELVREAIAEKRAEVAEKRAEILKNLGKREWKTVGEPTTHNIKF
jgi:hypothetical protein